jgi:anti-sigma factor RsiW
MMGHSEAERLGLAASYVLGLLESAEQLAFELHFFECAECAADLQLCEAFCLNWFLLFP